MKNIEDVSSHEKNILVGIIARINKPQTKGEKFTIHFLHYPEDRHYPLNQHSYIVNYSGKYGSKFFKDLDLAQREGKSIGVVGECNPHPKRHIYGEIEADEIHIFEK